MDFNEELTGVLRTIGLRDPIIELAPAASGRVGGFVISDSFDGMTQIDRQSMLWNRLGDILDREKRLRIVSLLTLTPAEAEDAE